MQGFSVLPAAEGKTGETYDVDASSVKVSESELAALVRAKGSEKALTLKLTQYDGILRLHITEADHARAEVGVFGNKCCFWNETCRCSQ